ncbi:Predicted arabinose efflux permease, MFS family [Actinacidiphila yanglinensis]|uniref:Predicted arabinose efflux permease, MFS family n=1 Tax=Actinacidiphila yanglinensis TaxID=310779 RepID=A0A1H6B9S6_9ACTN|nr:MFS transporter [Actinacidiphila yanglinensis]SEG56926.1 Predicted arabinose efflux permease, MFS family [Actinacidiphila yanglinensis]
MASDRGGTQRPWYALAALAFAIVMVGTTIPTPLYGLYRAEIGFSEFLVTVVFAVYACGVIAALLVAGDFSDVLGRRPVLLVGVGLSLLSAVCFVFEGGLPALFVGRLLSGFAAGLFSGAATAAVTELAPPGQHGRAALTATAANMGGLGCGPLIAGLLAQYEPHPLRLPYLVHLALLVVAGGIIRAMPETVAVKHPRPPLRPQGVVVPPGTRGVFVPAALSAFAGFSVLGLFTAVSPTFVAVYLDVDDLAVSGLIVLTVFLSSLAGQMLMGRTGAVRALPLGCAVLTVGLVLIGCSLLVESLPVLVVGAVVSGLGQGLAFRSSVANVSRVAPAEQRGATISGLFVVAYVGISVPVVGIGALAVAVGLRSAGVIFVACVIVVATTVAGYLVRHPMPAA